MPFPTLARMCNRHPVSPARTHPPPHPGLFCMLVKLNLLSTVVPSDAAVSALLSAAPKNVTTDMVEAGLHWSGCSPSPLSHTTRHCLLCFYIPPLRVRFPSLFSSVLRSTCLAVRSSFGSASLSPAPSEYDVVVVAYSHCLRCCYGG